MPLNNSLEKGRLIEPKFVFNPTDILYNTLDRASPSLACRDYALS